jgi:C1A family cysteine protease
METESSPEYSPREAQNSFSSYAERLTRKRVATQEELAIYRFFEDGRVAIQTGERTFVLEREDEQDSLDNDEKDEAEAFQPFWDQAVNAPENAGCPNQVDHRPNQTPIKDQDDRGTCVCFAALANLEAILKVQGNENIALSEQYANWLFMKFEGKDQCEDGLRTTLAARYLSLKGVCKEADCPYEDMTTVQTHCTSQPSAQSQSNAKYGIERYALIDRLGPLGPSIANPDYVEAILCRGFDIVFGTNVAWGKPTNDGVYDVILDKYGNPQISRGGHAMLIVGYNRGTALPYFICKNSWGVGYGTGGYLYISYDYMRTYAKYGYITQKVKVDF